FNLVELGEKAGDEERRRAAKEFIRRAGLDDSAGTEHDDAVGDADRVLRIMGDEDRGGPRLAKEFDGAAADEIACAAGEIGKGLVHEDDIPPPRQGTGASDSLLLAARDEMRKGVAECGEADAIEQIARDSFTLGV